MFDVEQVKIKELIGDKRYQNTLRLINDEKNNKFDVEEEENELN